MASILVQELAQTKLPTEFTSSEPRYLGKLGSRHKGLDRTISVVRSTLYTLRVHDDSRLW